MAYRSAKKDEKNGRKEQKGLINSHDGAQALKMEGKDYLVVLIWKIKTLNRLSRAPLAIFLCTFFKLKAKPLPLKPVRVFSCKITSISLK